MSPNPKRLTNGQAIYLRPTVYADLKALLAINGRGINDTVNEAVMRLVGEELGRAAGAVEMEVDAK